MKGSDVWLYDFGCSKWQKGAEIPVWQDGSRFASAADLTRGLIYVGGGFCNWIKISHKPPKPIRCAFVYIVEGNEWQELPAMNTRMADSRGAFADGKFFDIGSSSPTFEVFDAYARSWKTMENTFHSLHLTAAFGRFYFFSGRGLIEYDYAQDKLHIVGLLPTEDWWTYVMFAVVVSNKIFVIKEESNGRHQSFYMLSPSSETGETKKSMEISRPLGFQGYAMGAVTLDF